MIIIVEHESDGDTIYNWCPRYNYQRISIGTGRVGNNRTSGDGIIKISQNTEKSPGDLRRFAITQTPVRNHRLTLVGKLEKEYIIIK